MAHQQGKKTKSYFKIEHAYNLLLKGLGVPDIVKIFDEDYGLSYAQTTRYIREAQADIRRLSEIRKEEALEKQLHRYDSLYHEARESDDLKAAIDALKRIDSLKGLDVRKVDVTSGGDKITSVTVEFILPTEKKDENKS